MYHVIPRMHSANFVNKYGDFGTPSISMERLNIETSFLVDLFIIMNVKTSQFKTWCKGDKSKIENSTDHFCEDIRQNALAALTNLGHVTPFLLLYEI